jgi:hypothetical protein
MIYNIGGSIIRVDDVNEGGNQMELFLELIPASIPIPLSILGIFNACNRL